jgi:hypothetical protein
MESLTSSCVVVDQPVAQRRPLAMSPTGQLASKPVMAIQAALALLTTKVPLSVMEQANV